MFVYLSVLGVWINLNQVRVVEAYPGGLTVYCGGNPALRPVEVTAPEDVRHLEEAFNAAYAPIEEAV